MAVSNSFTAQSNSRQSVSSSKKKSGKFGGAFKKVGRYLQQQAQEQSHSALYLAPPDLNNTHKTQHIDDDLPTYLANDASELPYGVIPPIPSSNNNTPQSHYTTSSTNMSLDPPADPDIINSLIRHQYASDNILQSYDVLIPDRPQHPPSESGYFLIFIHGGYFRDPKRTSKSICPTISLLESSPPAIKDRITGYASLNYRLSPHPDYPQNPSTTDPYTLNVARWPDQPHDILAALRHIQSHYPQSKRYILAGHSVGATLSFIAALRCHDEGLIPPTTVLGLCGIYDFPRIHRTNEGYEDLTKGAMDPLYYNEASPGLVDADGYRGKWTVTGNGKRGVVLAHPATDELVGTNQTEVMADVFREGGGVDDGFEMEVVEGMVGTHWEILENGELARCFGRAVGLSG